MKNIKLSNFDIQGSPRKNAFFNTMLYKDENK